MNTRISQLKETSQSTNTSFDHTKEIEKIEEAVKKALASSESFPTLRIGK